MITHWIKDGVIACGNKELHDGCCISIYGSNCIDCKSVFEKPVTPVYKAKKYPDKPTKRSKYKYRPVIVIEALKGHQLTKRQIELKEQHNKLFKN